MGDSDTPTDDLDLGVLAGRLTAAGMPTQAVIAREAGVSQSTVSRAAQGLIKTGSDGARRLWDFTAGRAAIVATSPAPAGRAPRSAGPSRRRPRPRARLDRSSATDLSALTRPELGELAIAGLRDYLADAFDPLLVIEQLSVLRRAQDRGPR